MRILLDECLPRQLANEIAGHEVDTVAQAGWAGTKNGELLRLAALAYDVFLTIDRRLRLEQPIPPTLAVITVKAPTNRIESLMAVVPAIIEAMNALEPGQSIRVEA